MTLLDVVAASRRRRTTTPPVDSPAYRSHVFKTFNTAGPANPAGLQLGDVVIGFMYFYYMGEALNPGLNGWTLIGSIIGSSDGNYGGTYYRVVDGTFPPDMASSLWGFYGRGFIAAYSGVSAVGNHQDWQDIAGTFPSTEFNLPSDGAGKLTAGFMGGSHPFIPASFPGGFTQRSSPYDFFQLWDKPGASAGETYATDAYPYYSNLRAFSVALR